ncbi:hypothetical protein Fleli_2117 [Bernardetia litoralis DSM 6794]|uniref:Uncharacterized protein n=1 Tax=Bernardetia litoralis (strain ATCC 23117 / DSM 6794 / NBRC 15988 / NCIMB 1366 / Fx l1 / Sio-4) TaxID=880071 RepID=I4AKL4_BERLS|nr:hypothetical protein Fleli_2117 [Bernardetia litoralis DSM 6794]
MVDFKEIEIELTEKKNMLENFLSKKTPNVLAFKV